MSESLFFEDHLNFYKKLFAVKGDPNKSTTQKAWEGHALAVLNPLQDLNTKAIIAAEKLASKDAKAFLKYGAGRRLIAIWYSYSSIIRVAHTKRTEPLKDHEAHELNKDINLIYMHLRGVLDNYAWVYCYEQEPHLLKDKKGKEKKFIGLFNKDFPQESTNKNFWAELEKYKDWATELSNKRDPVAHRIPLNVVPSILTSDEHDEYQSLQVEHNAALVKFDFDKLGEIHHRQRSLGTFPMVFAHNPEEKILIPIYPTIPNDMGNLIEIQNIVLRQFAPNS